MQFNATEIDRLLRAITASAVVLVGPNETRDASILCYSFCVWYCLRGLLDEIYFSTAYHPFDGWNISSLLTYVICTTLLHQGSALMLVPPIFPPLPDRPRLLHVNGEGIFMHTLIFTAHLVSKQLRKSSKDVSACVCCRCLADNRF